MVGAPAVSLRTELVGGDLDRIVALHGRLYAREHGLDSTFESWVAEAVGAARVKGFPGPTDAVRIAALGAELVGSAVLTDEGGGLGMLRWVLLDPRLRDRGIGRGMITSLVDGARGAGYRRLALTTFAELTRAAAIYRSLGFELVDEERGPRWGRESIAFQRYELDLR